MLFGAKDLVTLCLCCGILLPGRGQTPALAPLSVHTVRSISPADTDFGDLEFLTQEIGPARVVMLGEPSHGEGNVFEAKIRLLRFLQQKMGFTTVAFESGFYDLHKAQQELESGKSAQEALGNSVFSIWTSTQEFQPLLPLVGKSGLRVAGFDPQLSGEYGGDLTEELQDFLAPVKGAATPNYDYLEEVIGYMGEHFAFLPSAKLAYFEKEMAKAARLAEKAAASPDPKRRAEAAFWQQCLRSLLAQARDYAANDPSAKSEATFKAKDSNPRDAQMADNLLWYLRQHPKEKVVCWGALPHLANKIDALEDAEMNEYRPMGRAVKATLGADQVYVLGTLSGGGSYGAFGANVKLVPPPAAGTLEAELLTQPAEYAFVSLKHDAPSRILTTYAFDYKPLAGPWSEVVDGFLFLKTVNPSHIGSVVTVAAAPTAATAPEAGAAVFNPVLRRASGTVRATGAAAAGQTVRGVVLDQKTKAPVPYASVSVPGKGVGTMTDAQGRFALVVPGAGSLQISSVGYTTATVAPASSVTVRLAPAAYELQGVQVQGESLDPRKIMKKVLAALPKNYEQQDYSSEVYTHRQTTNFDTLSYETEYISQLFEPAGHRNWGGGFLMLGPVGQRRVKEIHVAKALDKGQKFFSEQAGPGFIGGTTDAIRISPLFKTSTFRKFNVHLDSVLEQAGGTVYVISFAAKHATHRSTGTYLTSGYSGRLYVQQRDYAVTRYESLWLADTAYINRVARQHGGQSSMAARLYPNVLTDSRTNHTADYVRAPNGRYYLRHSLGQSLDVGRTLGGSSFYRQSSCEEYHSLLPAGTPPILSKAEMTTVKVQEEMAKLPPAEYHPAFWQTYQRPSALVEAAAPAAKP
jgi:erythromycin esterase-like protein